MVAGCKGQSTLRAQKVARAQEAPLATSERSELAMWGAKARRCDIAVVDTTSGGERERGNPYKLYMGRSPVDVRVPRHTSPPL